MNAHTKSKKKIIYIHIHAKIINVKRKTADTMRENEIHFANMTEKNVILATYAHCFATGSFFLLPLHIHESINLLNYS